MLQRVPSIVDPLRDGRLCFSTVIELAKVLTPENQGEVLPRFFHCSKKEAQAVSAELRPDEAPPRRDVVTAVRAPAAIAPVRVAAQQADATAAQVGMPLVHPDELRRANEAAPAPAPGPARPPAPLPPAPPRDLVDPLTADLDLAARLTFGDDWMDQFTCGLGRVDDPVMSFEAPP